jgi:ATP-dependent HslUV protease ATP-binding subunit HslU
MRSADPGTDVNRLLDHRLAKMTESPFIKVEATKYTELGYVGHDVEDIVKDLLEAGIALARQRMRTQLAAEAQQRTEDRILRALLGQHSGETEMQVGLGCARGHGMIT